MQAYEISKEITIEMGHRLPNHGGKCRNIHGHSYKLELFVESETLHPKGSSEGMVEDYSAMKKAMEAIDAIFDHTLVLSIDDPILIPLMDGSLESKQDYIKRAKELSDLFTTFSGAVTTRLVVIKNPPTAEVLGTVWLYIIRRMFDELTKESPSLISKLSVRETATSCAIIRANVDITTHFLNYADWRRPS